MDLTLLMDIAVRDGVNARSSLHVWPTILPTRLTHKQLYRLQAVLTTYRLYCIYKCWYCMLVEISLFGRCYDCHIMQERVNVKHIIDLTDALVVHIWISLRSRKTHRLGIMFSDLIYSLINYKRNLRRPRYPVWDSYFLHAWDPRSLQSMLYSCCE